VVATIGFLRGAAYRRGITAITCPVLLLHGTRDRLVPLAAARAAARANPSWSLVEFLGVGHVPQLEIPDETAKVIVEWLGSSGRAAAESATHAPPPAAPAPAAP
jgi:pimeloyl-ACP methyl ester carboxylesterase